jgi:tetratricopeptide (TPR) repeat protein
MNAEKEGKEVAQKYGVHGYPTILFIGSDGMVVGKIGGYEGPEAFAADMKKFVSSYREYPKLQKALKATPNDPAANAKMAAILAARDDQKGAEAALAKAEKANYSGPALATAYNAIGDTYQNAQKFDEAIAYFKKADASAKDAAARGYARISIMYCYMGKQDMASAKKVAQQVINTPGMDPEYVKMAKQLLGQGG